MSVMFIKYKPYNLPDNYLLCEFDGLEKVKSALAALPDVSIDVPEVYSANNSQLYMQKINFITGTIEHMKMLGQGLALMHQVEYPCYGYKIDNYLGLAPQINGEYDNWGCFFVENRLRFQVNRIRQTRIKNEFSKILQRHHSAVVELLNQNCAYPSLLHGDLWSGNVLFDINGVWLIDPAVYYGDRDADLAMTELFGGFDKAFYQSYDAILPRSKNYSIKKIIYNLYHYLNHYNLFGVSYLPACKQGFDFLSKMKGSVN